MRQVSNKQKGVDSLRPKEGNCVHGHRICGVCNHNWEWFLKKGCEEIYDIPNKGGKRRESKGRSRESEKIEEGGNVQDH